MRRLFALICLSTLSFAADDISAKRYLDNVKYLASDELKGRGNSLPELQTAARYVEAPFKACGLKPVNGSYFQKYKAVVGSEQGANNRLPGYTPRVDFPVMGLCDCAKLSGPVV